MNGEENKDYSGFSLLELFRSEAESQVQVLTAGLLALDRGTADATQINAMMRAAHSLKGAARIVNLESVERLSHAMEDCFVAAQKGKLQLNKERIDRLLAGVDLISDIAALNEAAAPAWLEEHKLRIANLLVDVYDAADPLKFGVEQSAEPAAPAGDTTPASPPATDRPAPSASSQPSPSPSPSPVTQQPARAPTQEDQVLKVSARHFDRLLALASESKVAAHAMQKHLQSLHQIKKRQNDMFSELEKLREALLGSGVGEAMEERLRTMQQRVAPIKTMLSRYLAELDGYERRLSSVSQQTLDEVLTLRMRPLRDGVHALPRMVRDLARSLGKQAHLEIIGENTLVDRDTLASIESPLNQLLRNAVDHGIEPPEQRISSGKPAEGTIRLEARHSAGMLSIQVSDDGRGVNLEGIRRKIVERGMASADMAAAMSSAELLEFLFLPAFSLKETATEVSGRGVGLDIVVAAIRQLYGSVRLETESGNGLRIHLTLPLSQSIVRALVVDMAGEAYAVPISKIERVLRVAREEIHTLENRQFFTLHDQHIGLISAAQLLEIGPAHAHFDRPDVPVIVIGSGMHRYALAVDAIRGEQSLAVQPIDAIFGKTRDISSAALLDDGSPVLILDIVDMLVSIGKLLGEGGLQGSSSVGASAPAAAKRVLVVDDSLTVREMERKLLEAHGFEVDVAVDGMDGWNALRSSSSHGGNVYQLVITDVDMPRMDGIELVTLIKKDSRLHNLPVMIVSYKERPEDRARGIDAGADYYLTKGSFHDDSLLEAVYDLIGGGDT